MSDQQKAEGRGSRSTEGRGSRISTFGRRSDEPGQQPGEPRAASTAGVRPVLDRPQRPGPGLYPGVAGPVTLDSSRTPGRYPLAAGQSMSPTRHEGPSHIRAPGDESGAVVGRAKPTDVEPTGSKYNLTFFCSECFSWITTNIFRLICSCSRPW